MNIGDKVSIKDVRRAMHWNGHIAYFDNGIDIDGVVTAVAYFITKKVTVNFKHEGRDYSFLMDEPTGNQ